jgi:hypothetical protein
LYRSNRFLQPFEQGSQFLFRRFFHVKIAVGQERLHEVVEEDNLLWTITSRRFPVDGRGNLSVGRQSDFHRNVGENGAFDQLDRNFNRGHHLTSRRITITDVRSGSVKFGKGAKT